MLKRFFPRSLWGRAMFALAALVLVLGLFLIGRSAVNRIALSGSYRTIVSSYPSLVIERVKFSKYLVQGTVADVDPHFAKLDIWLVKGSADIQYDLSEFSLDAKKTDYLNKILCLSYHGKDPVRAVFDVNVNPADIRQVESIKPERYSEDEIKSMTQTVAIGAGATGALVGGAVAGSSSPSVASFIPVLSYAGGVRRLVGAASGGALAAGTAWCFTDDFISALQGAGKGPVSVMDMIAAAEPLVAKELAGSGENETSLRAAFESRLESIARSAGWNGVMVNYGGAR